MDELFSRLDSVGAETKYAIERFMNNKQMYLKYVLAFPNEPTMKQLVKAVEEKDYAAAEEAVHAMKGIVSTLEFNPLTDATIDMLAELRDNNIKDAHEAFENLQEQYQIFCEVIQKITD